MEKKQYEELLNILLQTGADFSEVFYEDTIRKIYEVTDSKLNDISVETFRGIGLRMIKDNDTYYSSSK